MAKAEVDLSVFVGKLLEEQQGHATEGISVPNRRPDGERGFGTD